VSLLSVQSPVIIIFNLLSTITLPCFVYTHTYKAYNVPMVRYESQSESRAVAR